MPRGYSPTTVRVYSAFAWETTRAPRRRQQEALPPPLRVRRPILRRGRRQQVRRLASRRRIRPLLARPIPWARARRQPIPQPQRERWRLQKPILLLQQPPRAGAALVRTPPLIRIRRLPRRPIVRRPWQ